MWISIGIKNGNKRWQDNVYRDDDTALDDLAIEALTKWFVDSLKKIHSGGYAQ